MELADKKILVTGGAGFLGTHIINKLLERGVLLENIFSPRSHEYDLRRRDDCRRAVAGRDIVIHAAGVTGNAEFHKKHPGEIFYANLTMGVELLEAARQAGIQKCITIGSATEYPEQALMPLNEEDLWVGPVASGHAAYSIAKKMLAVQARAYRSQYGFNAIHLLLTSMYGPGEKIDGGPIPSLAQRIADAKATNADSITIWGTGNATRDFLYAEDAAEGIVLAAEKYDKPEPVNLGLGREISIRNLAETMAEIMYYKGNLIFDPTKPEGQIRRVLDVSKAESEFGFKAANDFIESLKKTILSHGY